MIKSTFEYKSSFNLECKSVSDAMSGTQYINRSIPHPTCSKDTVKKMTGKNVRVPYYTYKEVMLEKSG